MASWINMFLLNISPLGNSRFLSSRLDMSSSFLEIWRTWVLSCLLDKVWRWWQTLRMVELFVSGIHHNSFIEVNEEGTEAAAVTAAVLMGCARRLDMEYDLDFVADHPFAFVIRENTTNIVQKLDVHWSLFVFWAENIVNWTSIPLRYQSNGGTLGFYGYMIMFGKVWTFLLVF